MSKATIDRHDEAERERKLSALHERLAAEVEVLSTGEDWQRWLATAARFHTYSFQNTLLIHAQRPDATRVAGYQVWRTLGRQVTKGEKGIAILAPVIRRTPTEEQQGYDANQSEAQRTLAGFRLTHVWDVDQTTGAPLPEPAAPTLLEGQAPTGLWDSLAAEVTRAGFELQRGACGTANGTTNFTTRVVRVRDDVDDPKPSKPLPTNSATSCSTSQPRPGQDSPAEE